MRILILSDLHLDFCDNYNRWIGNKFIKDFFDIIIVAGDVYTNCGKNKEKIRKFFFEECIYPFCDYVIEVPGNHDYWGNTFEKYNKKSRFYHIKDHLNPNHILLNNDSIVIKGWNFIGSTLWSFIKLQQELRVRYMLNDFNYIKCFSSEKYNDLHLYSKRKIEDLLQITKPGKSIVITHHAPSYSLLNKAYGDEISSAYASSLEDIMLEYKPKYWIFGHSHSYCRTKIYDTECISNCYGYPGSDLSNFTTDQKAQIIL